MNARDGLRERVPLRDQFGEPGLQSPVLGPGRRQGRAQPVGLFGQRPDRLPLVAQSPQLPNQPNDLVVLPPDRRLVILGPPQGLAELLVLLLQRRDPAVLTPPTLRRRPSPPVLHRLHGRAHPGDHHAYGRDPGVPTASLGIGFAQECLQALQLRLKGKRRIHLAAELFLLLLSRRQLAPARAEPRLPCLRLATGGSFGLAQFRAARLRRVRSRLFPVRTGVLALIQRQQIARLAFRRGCRRKPSAPADFVRRQVRCGKISVENDHALDDSVWLSVLPAPLRDPKCGQDHDPSAASPRPDGTITIRETLCVNWCMAPYTAWNRGRPVRGHRERKTS